jgi:hypothetical protein
MQLIKVWWTRRNRSMMVFAPADLSDEQLCEVVFNACNRISDVGVDMDDLPEWARPMRWNIDTAELPSFSMGDEVHFGALVENTARIWVCEPYGWRVVHDTRGM